MIWQVSEQNSNTTVYVSADFSKCKKIFFKVLPTLVSSSIKWPAPLKSDQQQPVQFLLWSLTIPYILSNPAHITFTLVHVRPPLWAEPWNLSCADMCPNIVTAILHAVFAGTITWWHSPSAADWELVTNGDSDWSVNSEVELCLCFMYWLDSELLGVSADIVGNKCHLTYTYMYINTILFYIKIVHCITLH